MVLQFYDPDWDAHTFTDVAMYATPIHAHLASLVRLLREAT